MKRIWIRADRMWCLLFVLAVSRVTGSISKTIEQVKPPIPTKESLPQLAEVLNAATYLEDNDDELEKNFEGQRNNYKRTARKLGTADLDKSSDLQEYQGVVGRPGVDFPILPSIPHTDFNCKKVQKSGYYADPETDCQVFHICDGGRKVSFLCPNGTVFRQSHLICDWWFRVDCERSIELYEESAEQLASDQRVFKERAEALAKAMLKVQTTPQNSDRVVTERSFGSSTTVFNSESRLPERARYFSGYSRDENQLSAETASFVGNQYQTNFNSYQSKTPVENSNQGNFKSGSGNNNYQSGSYQSASTTTSQPIWNQAVNNNYQSGSYQTPSTTTAQPTWNQAGNNNYQSSSYQAQSTTTSQPIWNQAVNNNYQSGSYQAQSTTTSQPIWNQAVNNNYQSGSYQTPSTTTAQPTWNQAGNNNYQSSSYQAQSTTSTKPSSVQGVNKFQQNYQPQLATATSQINWNQGSNNYQPGNFQTLPTTASTQENLNNQGTSGSQTENYQSYTPTTAQSNWNQGSSSYQTENYHTPSTIAPIQTNWNNQGTNNFQTVNYQTSPSTPAPAKWNNNKGTNQFGTVNYQKPVIATTTQTDWNQAVNDLQTNNYQSQAVTTVQPDWSQESDTILPNIYQPQQSYQQPTTIFPGENEQNVPVKESQVPAETASFVGHQSSHRFNFQPENFYTQAPQTNSPQTTYPVTNSYSNDYSPSGAFSFVEYQRSPDTPVARDYPTQAPPVTTTVPDYTTVSNSTYPPTGETLIPNMINSLQTLTDNNLLFDLDGQNAYPSQTNTDDDEFNTVALYFNNIKSPQVTTVASDLQFNYFEKTSRTFTDGASSVSSNSIETTTPVDNLQLPAVLTQNTKEAYDKLFKNDTVKEPTTTTTTTVKPTDTTKNTPSTTNLVNVGFSQGLNLNRSSAELRELAAVFTRALTAYLDDPENFRKILAEVRPTEPPSARSSVSDEQEVLDFSDDSKTQRNKNTERSTASSPYLSAEINGMTRSINGLADLSTTVPQYTSSPLIDITSKYTEASNAGLQEYAPPADSEQLQVAGSQSFYSSRDNSFNNGQTAKTLKPATSTMLWTVSPIIDTEQDIKTTTPSPVYFTTTAEDLETTVIVQRAKEMFSHLNASEAGILMNVMQNAQTNDTVKRLVLLLVNDPNKENTPEQTRHNIIAALLDNGGNPAADQTYESPSSQPPPPPPSVSTYSSSPAAVPDFIQFGQRLQEDGTPVTADGGSPNHKKMRKGMRRRVQVHKTRAVTSAPVTTTPIAWQGAAVVGETGPPPLSSDSDARAVELLKSLYSIASKWS